MDYTPESARSSGAHTPDSKSAITHASNTFSNTICLANGSGFAYLFEAACSNRAHAYTSVAEGGFPGRVISGHYGGQSPGVGRV